MKMASCGLCYPGKSKNEIQPVEVQRDDNIPVTRFYGIEDSESEK